MRSLLPLLGLAGCAWAAAEGPWNDGEDNGPSRHDVEFFARLDAEERPFGPVDVVTIDGDGVLEPLGALAGDGRATLSLPEGRHEVLVGTTLAQAAVSVVAPGPEVAVVLRCSEASALVVASADAQWSDPYAARLRSLGFGQVHEPEPAEGLGVLSTPQGLGAYSLVVLLDSIAPAADSLDESTADNLRSFVEGGGTLWLQGRWGAVLPLVDGGEPTRWEMSPPTATVESRSSALSEALGWAESLPSPPVAREQAVALDRLAPILVRVAVAGAETLLHGRAEVGGGVVHWTNLRAPQPTPGRWWRGDPEPWILPDGTWDAAPSLVDHLLLLD